MAKRGKRPEDYGQLALFEVREPDWLKSENLLGYTLDPHDNPVHDAASDFPFAGTLDDTRSSVDSADDDDELGQFVEWLERKK